MPFSSLSRSFVPLTFPLRFIALVDETNSLARRRRRRENLISKKISPVLFSPFLFFSSFSAFSYTIFNVISRYFFFFPLLLFYVYFMYIFIFIYLHIYVYLSVVYVYIHMYNTCVCPILMSDMYIHIFILHIYMYIHDCFVNKLINIIVFAVFSFLSLSLISLSSFLH